MSEMDRRDFCKWGLAGVGSLALGSSPFEVLAQSPDPDHFYLQLVVRGGIDTSYMFDARPLEMTKKELIQNYHGEEPFSWQGLNGQTTWASPLVKSLEAYKNDFSIINGVHMATDFDGHEQNLNFLFTGNPFGGESFLPWLAEKGKYPEVSITGVRSGSFENSISNHGGIVPLGGVAGAQLVNQLKKSNNTDFNNPLYKFVQSRYQQLSQGAGKLSNTNKMLHKSYSKSTTLYKQFENLKINTKNKDPITQFVSLIQNVFQNKICRTAMMAFEFQGVLVDCHDSQNAMKHPQLVDDVVGRIQKFLDLLKSTPYDSQRSLLDVTTVCFASEFGRTMKQNGVSFNQTATDHNSLCNTLLLAGKGIKGGQLIGESDFRTANEKLSQAHLRKDPRKLKNMGKPFDFKTMKPTQKMPTDFTPSDYLNVGSVANTVMSLFGVPKSYYRKDSRFGDASPLLTGLIR